MRPADPIARALPTGDPALAPGAAEWRRIAAAVLHEYYGLDAEQAAQVALVLWDRSPAGADPAWVVQTHVDSDEPPCLDPDDPAAWPRYLAQRRAVAECPTEHAEGLVGDRPRALDSADELGKLQSGAPSPADGRR